MTATREQTEDDPVPLRDTGDAGSDRDHRPRPLVTEYDREWHLVLAGVEAVVGVADARRFEVHEDFTGLRTRQGEGLHGQRPVLAQDRRTDGPHTATGGGRVNKPSCRTGMTPFLPRDSPRRGMGSHETGAPSPRAECPLPATARRLSWRLGERIVGDGDGPAVELERDGGRASVAVYEATAHTAVVAVRTPVGRRHYFEVPRPGVERAVEAATSEGWRLADASA
jgi:hypothetical protein